MIENAARAAMDIYFMLPSCVPATHMETSGAELTAADIEKLWGYERVIGLAEMMNYPGLVSGAPEVLAKASEDAILMHPLPRKHEMGTEADHAVLDNDPRSVYFHQMQNGMYMRMALLAGVLGAHD